MGTCLRSLFFTWLHNAMYEFRCAEYFSQLANAEHLRGLECLPQEELKEQLMGKRGIWMYNLQDKTSCISSKLLPPCLSCSTSYTASMKQQKYTCFNVTLYFFLSLRWCVLQRRPPPPWLLPSTQSSALRCCVQSSRLQTTPSTWPPLKCRPKS